MIVYYCVFLSMILIDSDNWSFWDDTNAKSSKRDFVSWLTDGHLRNAHGLIHPGVSSVGLYDRQAWQQQLSLKRKSTNASVVPIQIFFLYVHVLANLKIFKSPFLRNESDLVLIDWICPCGQLCAFGSLTPLAFLEFMCAMWTQAKVYPLYSICGPNLEQGTFFFIKQNVFENLLCTYRMSRANSTDNQWYHSNQHSNHAGHTHIQLY